MTTKKYETFPVLDSPKRGQPKRSVRWALVEPFRESCMQFHSQTLERLAERSGLGVEELYFHYERRVLTRGSDADRELVAKLTSGRLTEAAEVWFERWSRTPET